MGDVPRAPPQPRQVVSLAGAGRRCCRSIVLGPPPLHARPARAREPQGAAAVRGRQRRGRAGPTAACAWPRRTVWMALAREARHGPARRHACVRSRLRAAFSASAGSTSCFSSHAYAKGIAYRAAAPLALMKGVTKPDQPHYRAPRPTARPRSTPHTCCYASGAPMPRFRMPKLRRQMRGSRAGSARSLAQALHVFHVHHGQGLLQLA